MVERISPWKRTLDEYGVLEGALQRDVAVIGAGIAGAACAYEFSARGYSTVLLEKGQIGFGASGAGTGILIPEDGGMYFLAEPEELSERDAVYCWQVNREMQDALYETLERINVKYERTGALALGLYRDPDRESVMRSMREEDELRRKFGLSRVEVLTPREAVGYIDSSRIALALHYPKDEVAAVSPVEMLEGLIRASGAEVYTGCEVLKVKRSGKRYEILTDSGCVTARKVIVATHGMLSDLTFDLPGYSVGDFIRPRYAHVISIRQPTRSGARSAFRAAKASGSRTMRTLTTT
jgi:gamma-glutamylputrescine oxidase